MSQTPPLRSTARLNYRRYKPLKSHESDDYKPEVPKETELFFDDIARANNETYKDRLAAHYSELKTIVNNDVLPRLKAAKASSAKRLQQVNLPAESIQKIQKTKLFHELKLVIASIDRRFAYAFVTGALLLVVGVNLLSGTEKQTLGVNAGPQPVYDAELGANIAAEASSIDDVRVVISRQELPAKYRSDASLLEELAKSRSFDGSTQTLEITRGTAYLATQEDDSQVVVMALDGQLLFMTTDSFVLPSSWTNYIESLNQQT